MQRRNQMPFYGWGMPPRQMDHYQHSSMNPMIPRHQGQIYQMGENGGMGDRGQGRSLNSRQGGGFLSRIFGKKNTPTGGFPGLYPAVRGGESSGESILKSLTDPNSISGFLNNTQSVLQAAKQISPLISQYGPLIQNIPAMWKLYQGLKGATTEEDEENTKESKNVEKSESSESIGELDDLDIVPFDSEVEREDEESSSSFHDESDDDEESSSSFDDDSNEDEESPSSFDDESDDDDESSSSFDDESDDDEESSSSFDDDSNEDEESSSRFDDEYDDNEKRSSRFDDQSDDDVNEGVDRKKSLTYRSSESSYVDEDFYGNQRSSKFKGTKLSQRRSYPKLYY